LSGWARGVRRTSGTSHGPGGRRSGPIRVGTG